MLNYQRVVKYIHNILINCTRVLEVSTILELFNGHGAIDGWIASSRDNSSVVHCQIYDGFMLVS